MPQFFLYFFIFLYINDNNNNNNRIYNIIMFKETSKSLLTKQRVGNKFPWYFPFISTNI